MLSLNSSLAHCAEAVCEWLVPSCTLFLCSARTCCFHFIQGVCLDLIRVIRQWQGNLETPGSSGILDIQTRSPIFLYKQMHRIILNFENFNFEKLYAYDGCPTVSNISKIMVSAALHKLVCIMQGIRYFGLDAMIFLECIYYAYNRSIRISGHDYNDRIL